MLKFKTLPGITLSCCLNKDYSFLRHFAMNYKIDLADLSRKDPASHIELPGLTLDQHRIIHDFCPGHKFAYLYKDDKKGVLKPNGYSRYVKEQCRRLGRAARPADYQNFSETWQVSRKISWRHGKETMVVIYGYLLNIL